MYWSSLLHHISTFLRVTMLLLYCRVIISQVKQKLHLVGYLLIRYDNSLFWFKGSGAVGCLYRKHAARGRKT